jgi:MFS transporter, SP family, sugar:H+ symporter
MYGLSPPVSIYDIAMGKLTKQLNALSFRREKRTSTDGSTTHSEKQMEKQKYTGPYDDTKVPLLTIHSFIMGVFVSMGGFIFGYDTGQISGFLGMAEFQQRFGQKNGNGDGGYHFSNVRSGLIVALLSVGTLMGALIGGPIADRIGRKWSISAWVGLGNYFILRLFHQLLLLNPI